MTKALNRVASKASRTAANLLAALAAALALSACASAPGSEMVVPSFGAFAKSSVDVPAGSSAAVLDVQFAGLKCADIRLVVGAEGAGGFVPVRQATIESQFGKGSDTALVPLQPGTYHLLQAVCRNGTNVNAVGANGQPGSIPWQGASWPQSLGSFTVEQGSVADLGTLSIARRGNKGFEQTATPPVSLSLGARGDTSAARLATSQPALVGRLRPAAFVLKPAPALALIKCKLVAAPEAEQTAKAAPLPSGDPGERLQGLSAKEPPPAGCQPVAAGGLGG